MNLGCTILCSVFLVRVGAKKVSWDLIHCRFVALVDCVVDVDCC